MTSDPATRAITSEIATFFEEFQKASREEDWDRYSDLFLPQFLNMDPTSSGPVARDDLIAFLPKRKGVFDRAGATGTTLASLDVEPMDDDRHVLVRTTWHVVFHDDRAPVVLQSTFVLRHENGWQIAVYLNHGSLLQLLGLA